MQLAETVEWTREERAELAELAELRLSQPRGSLADTHSSSCDVSCEHPALILAFCVLSSTLER